MCYLSFAFRVYVTMGRLTLKQGVLTSQTFGDVTGRLGRHVSFTFQ